MLIIIIITIIIIVKTCSAAASYIEKMKHRSAVPRVCVCVRNIKIRATVRRGIRSVNLLSAAASLVATRYSSISCYFLLFSIQFATCCCFGSTRRHNSLLLISFVPPSPCKVCNSVSRCGQIL